jgi:hypothetical protein
LGESRHLEKITQRDFQLMVGKHVIVEVFIDMFSKTFPSESILSIIELLNLKEVHHIVNISPSHFIKLISFQEAFVLTKRTSSFPDNCSSDSIINARASEGSSLSFERSTGRVTLPVATLVSIHENSPFLESSAYHW